MSWSIRGKHRFIIKLSLWPWAESSRSQFETFCSSSTPRVDPTSESMLMRLITQGTNGSNWQVSDARRTSASISPGSKQVALCPQRKSPAETACVRERGTSRGDSACVSVCLSRSSGRDVADCRLMLLACNPRSFSLFYLSACYPTILACQPYKLPC